MAYRPAVGEKVLASGKLGTVRFVGTTLFAAGEWIGVELDTPGTNFLVIFLTASGGKNNGCVQGEKYFECEPLHGLFVRATNCKPVSGDGSVPDSPMPTSIPPSPAVQSTPASVPVTPSTTLAETPASAKPETPAPAPTSATRPRVTSVNENQQAQQQHQQQIDYAAAIADCLKKIAMLERERDTFAKKTIELEEQV